MDTSIRLRKAWCDKRERGEWPQGRREQEPEGRVQHFYSQADRERHLEQVEQARKNGAPF